MPEDCFWLSLPDRFHKVEAGSTVYDDGDVGGESGMITITDTESWKMSVAWNND